jgi:hypothetical protein
MQFIYPGTKQRAARIAVEAFCKSSAGHPFPIAGPPTHRVLQLQRMIDNQGVLRLMASKGGPAGHAYDRHELEAESVAGLVPSMRNDEIRGGAFRPMDRSRGDRPQGQEDPNDRVDRFASVRRHQILQLQRMIGNQGVLRLMASNGVHLGHPNDRQELEADGVAGRVMSMRNDEIHSGALLPIDHIRGDRPQGQEDPNDRVDRFASSESPVSVSPPGPDIRAGLERLEGAGQPLAHSERSFFEPRFGTRFDAVRIHDGGEADHLARAINARAFTFNRHIVFRAGEYRPESHEGRSLLAHELAHTIQQGATVNASRRVGRMTPTQIPLHREVSGARQVLQRAVTNLAVAGAVAEAAAADHFVTPRGAGQLLSLRQPALRDRE